MDKATFLRAAGDEFEAARYAAARGYGFAAAAELVRKHMRSGTACLIRYAALANRSRREAAGQITFQWPTPPRGQESREGGKA